MHQIFHSLCFHLNFKAPIFARNWFFLAFNNVFQSSIIFFWQVNLHDPSIEVHHLPEVIEQSNADIYAIVRIEDPDEGRHGEVASLEIVDGDPEAHFRIRSP